MPEDDVDAFASYLHWACTQQVIVCDDEPTTKNTMISRFRGSVELHILADKLGDIVLQNDVVDQFRATVDDYGILPHHSIVQRLFAATPENCMLQKLVLDQYIYKSNPTLFSVVQVRTNPEVFVKVLKALATEGSRGGLLNGLPRDREAKCYYHVHNEDYPACE